MRQVLFALCAACAMTTTAQAATLTNGSMTGTVGAAATPAGWTPTQSVDITSSAVQPFVFINNPGDSSDGGTWAGLFSRGSYFEAITQTVTDFVVGQNYKLSWESANTGCCANLGTYDDANAIDFYLDGALAYAGTTLSVGDAWLDESYMFTATSTSHMLNFRVATGPTAYMGIDGVTLEDVSAPIPLPATGALLLTGLLGAAAVGRRRKKA